MKKYHIIYSILIISILISGTIEQLVTHSFTSYFSPRINSESLKVEPSDIDFSDAMAISDSYMWTHWNDRYSVDPEIAIDNNGEVHVVWTDATFGEWGGGNSDTEIMYASYTETIGWSDPKVISDGYLGNYWNDGESLAPAITVDNNRNVHVVWHDWTEGSWGTDAEIMYTRYKETIGWSNPIVISWNEGDSWWPDIAVDNNGKVYVVWVDLTTGPWGNDLEIMYSSYTETTGWSAPKVISDGYMGIYWNDGSSNSPKIAIDNDNDIHVVWHDSTGGEWGTDVEIMYTSYSEPIGWSNVTVISDGFSGTYWNNDGSYHSDIAVDNNDGIHVVWFDYTDGVWGNDAEIMYVNNTEVDGWSNVTIISDGYSGVYWNSGESYDPDICVDNNNSLHVVWEDLTEGIWGGGSQDTEIMYSKYAREDGWSNISIVSDDNLGNYWNNDDSRDPGCAFYNDRLYAVWEDSTNGEWGADIEIMVANYTETTDWSDIRVISDGYVWDYWNDGWSEKPSITVDNSGNFHVVWHDSTYGEWGTDTEIMYTCYTDATGWSNVEVISDGFGDVYWNDGESYNPKIAIDNDNNIHVVWEDSTHGEWGTDVEIMYSNNINVTGWSNPIVISDGFGDVYWNDGESYNPKIAIDNDNNIHVVWEDSTHGEWGTDVEIMYTSFTEPIGWSNVTIISDGFLGTYWNDAGSYSSAIAIDNNNRIHIVWFDYTDGVWGSDAEIMYVNYTESDGWSNATIISDGVSGVYWNNDSSLNPEITTESNGDLHVVWEDSTNGEWGTDTEIMYTNYTEATGWSNPVVISDGYMGNYWNIGDSYSPEITIGSNGDLHVVWEDSTHGEWGTDTEIMYTCYTNATGWSNPVVISDGYMGNYWNNFDSRNPDCTFYNDKLCVVWDDNIYGEWGTDREVFITRVYARPESSITVSGYNSFIIFLIIVIIGIIIYIKRK